MSEDQKERFKIKNRESWFKMIILSAFSAVILLKIYEGSFRVDLSALAFTDVLFLFLALFSILMSVLFYFKATDTSNQFYDNTYKFSNDMFRLLESYKEKLSNIEAQGRQGPRMPEPTTPAPTINNAITNSSEEDNEEASVSPSPSPEE